jgi:hypothetical protein
VTQGVELLTDLIRDAIRRIEQLGDKVDSKIDSLESKMREDSIRFKDSMEDRLSKVEDQVDVNSHEITKMRSTATILSWLVTGGIAGLIGIYSWFTGLLKIGH